VDAPEFTTENAITDNASVQVLFQGARAVRPGSRVPDPDTITEWVTDLTVLDGYELVRFQVVFDIGEDTVNYPFGLDSYRPEVDQLRLRTTY
jgi:hypothetical protein